MAKVLLVEDDNNLREIYQARLMAEGYDIVAAQNGEEALVIAKQSKPDLVISDVMMPRISGFEMLDILRNTDELKHTKVIMLTALGQAEDQTRAANLGADKYLVKSQVTLEDIVNAAKELLDEDGATATPPVPAPATDAAPPAVPTPSPPVAPADPTSAASAPTVPLVAPEAAAAAPAVPPAPPAAEPAVPASVVPQPDTTVVVPPAPANPAVPAVTVAVIPPEPTSSVTPTTDTPGEPVASTAVSTGAAAPVQDVPADTTAAAAASDSAAQTIEAEEAALQTEIDNYSKEPAEVPTVVEPGEAADNASNDAAIAEAVEELNAPEEAPVQPASGTNAVATAPPIASEPPVAEAPAEAPALEPAPAPAASASENVPANDNVNVAGKKVIQPITNPGAKPNLDELLAKEEAAAQAPAAAPPANANTSQAPTTAPPPVPGQSFDPNTVAL